MKWTIRIPDEMIPARSMNTRGHWSGRARHSKQVREAVGWLARSVLPPEPFEPGVTVTCIRVVSTRHRRDPDNLAAAFKPAIDGLVDAGVLPADHWPVVDTVAYTFRLADEPCWGIQVESGVPPP